MTGILTIIAIQLKGSLVFLLGLGGMYTTARALITGIVTLPEIDTTRASVALDGKRLVTQLRALALASVLLFIAAVWLYFGGPIGGIDADMLKANKAVLTSAQVYSIIALVMIAIILALIELRATVLRTRLGKLPTAK